MAANRCVSASLATASAWAAAAAASLSSCQSNSDDIIPKITFLGLKRSMITLMWTRSKAGQRWQEAGLGDKSGF